VIEKDLDSVGLGFDIIISGAGTAGCALASNLSKNFKVLLIDVKTFPRKKACSGILVSGAKYFFGSQIDKKVLAAPPELDIEYIDWDNDLRNFSRKRFLNSNRFELDKLLLDQVTKKPNASFLPNTRVVEFADAEDKNFKVVLCESNGIIKPIIAKYLIGCDGAVSLIRRKIFPRNIRFYVGVQELIKADFKLDKAYFIFDKEITDFYSWVIPKKPFLDVGSLLLPQNTKEKFSLFKRKLAKEFKIKGSGILSSAIVLRPESIKDVCFGKGNVLLCGEAAGLISPSSAEGISYALRSGKYCAEAFNAKNPNPLEGYSKNCKPLLSRLEEKFKKSKTISDKNKRKSLFL